MQFQYSFTKKVKKDYNSILNLKNIVKDNSFDSRYENKNIILSNLIDRFACFWINFFDTYAYITKNNSHKRANDIKKTVGCIIQCSYF